MYKSLFKSVTWNGPKWRISLVFECWILTTLVFTGDGCLNWIQFKLTLINVIVDQSKMTGCSTCTKVCLKVSHGMDLNDVCLFVCFFRMLKLMDAWIGIISYVWIQQNNPDCYYKTLFKSVTWNGPKWRISLAFACWLLTAGWLLWLDVGIKNLLL